MLTRRERDYARDESTTDANIVWLSTHQIEMWGVSSVVRSGDVAWKPARQQFWNLSRCHRARLRRAGMGEGSYKTLFSPSDITAFHRMKYMGKGVLYNLVFTEWRHCVSQNDQNNSVFDKPTRRRSCELSIGYTTKTYLIHHTKKGPESSLAKQILLSHKMSILLFYWWTPLTALFCTGCSGQWSLQHDVNYSSWYVAVAMVTFIITSCHRKKALASRI